MALAAEAHSCGCAPLPAPAACPHAQAPEIAENLAVASQYIHTVAIQRGAGAGGGEPEGLRPLRCFVCPEGECWRPGAGGAKPAFSACLQCFFIGCRHRGHLEQHCAATGHNLSLDLTLHKVHCRACGTYVHDRELEAHLERGRGRVMRRHRRPEGQRPASPPALSGGPVASVAVMREQAYARSSKAHILGLRGMVNMGNTCFMSSILQALVHNPFLRTVFLSDCEWSPAKTAVAQSPRASPDAAGGGAKAAATSPLRFDFLRLFAEMYSGETTPHAPYYLLHTVWKQWEHLSGYQQQDAHEFLIFILNQLHTQLHRALPAPNAPAPQAASGGASSSAAGTSIISRVFQGKLRSDVRCCGCGAASTTFDHFFDLPLDLTKVRAPGLRILDTDA